jgi:siroheme synthase
LEPASCSCCWWLPATAEVERVGAGPGGPSSLVVAAAAAAAEAAAAAVERVLRSVRVVPLSSMK